MNARGLIVAAAVAGASAVAIGAFAAHGLSAYLETRLPDGESITRRMQQFDTGARYHLVHAVVLLALVPLFDRSPKRVAAAAWLFVGGILIFSGSLYLLVLTNTPWLGAITPIGGLMWIVAWILLAFVRSNPLRG